MEYEKVANELIAPLSRPSERVTSILKFCPSVRPLVIAPSVILGGVSTTGTSVNPLSQAQKSTIMEKRAENCRNAFFMGLVFF